MNFRDFASALQKLEQISSRLEMTAELADVYQHLDDEEITVASYLLNGQPTPAYESLEFQLSTKMVIRALARLISDDDAETKVTALFKELGDLGLVAEKIRTNAASEAMKVVTVYRDLVAIAQESGAGSQEKKLYLLVELLKKTDPVSAKFIVRMVLGKLRLGFSTMTMLDALSWSVTQSKSESIALEEAYQKKADLGALAQTYLQHRDSPTARLQALAEYTVQVGVPVLPALCQRLNSADEIATKMGEVYVEPKYDGVRVQIHFQRQLKSQLDAQNQQNFIIKTFTRSLEENSHQFPELQPIAEIVNCDSCILDAEAIGYDKATGRLLPFQETITRKRKHEVEARAQSIPLKFFVFDILALNEKPLLGVELRKRKELLKNLFSNNEVFEHTPFTITDQPEEIRKFHHECLAEGLEGAVIKQTTSIYQSGRKGWSWVKIKEEEGTRGKLTDTVDCVIMGYYVGQGKRAQFGLGAFLVGVLNDEGQIKTIAKVGSGLSDEQFRELKQLADEYAVKEMPTLYQLVDKTLVPDVWLEPQLVAEVAADEITTSQIHTAGVALRFPRLVKLRPDKNWEQATTLLEIHSMSQPT